MIKIRSEREYWERYGEAEALQARGWENLTNDERNRLAALSYAIEQYEFGGSCRLSYSGAY